MRSPKSQSASRLLLRGPWKASENGPPSVGRLQTALLVGIPATGPRGVSSNRRRTVRAATNPTEIVRPGLLRTARPGLSETGRRVLAETGHPARLAIGPHVPPEIVLRDPSVIGPLVPREIARHVVRNGLGASVRAVIVIVRVAISQVEAGPAAMTGPREVDRPAAAQVRAARPAAAPRDLFVSGPEDRVH
jgi:hypothetical protein